MEQLEPKKGFNVDYRHAGLDGEACKFANYHFGRRFVDKVMDKYVRSVSSAESVRGDLLKYHRKYTTSTVRRDKTNLPVLQSIADDFTSKEKLVPLIGGAIKHEDFPRDKSCGLPWREKGFKTKGEALADKEVRGSIFRQWEAIGNGREGFGLPDTCAYFRAQLVAPDENKIRAVWGIPLDVIVEEFRFFNPYIRWLEQTGAPIAYCVEMATGGMAYINEMCDQFPNHKYLMVEYKEFDKSIPPWLIRDAFKIVFDSFNLTQVEDVEGKRERVNPARTKRRIRALVKYFINTPVRLPSGDRFLKKGGVPSGSMFTNIINSIVNAIIMRYCIYHTTGHLPAAEMHLGDDSFIIPEGITNLDDLTYVAKEKFEMDVHPKKSYLTTNPENVQFLDYFNRRGLPYKGHA
uniref:Putative replicase n=1 Tax=Potsystermes virus TaxID=2796626 RepID=A0A7T7K8T0_9VIRU|nr:putative replicase [Potsystermes virus]